MANPVSTANIFGHPIHPMLIPFPIAFFVATLACDAAFWQMGNPIWTTAATWLLGAGLVMAVLAALAGLTDFLGDARIRAIPARTPTLPCCRICMSRRKSTPAPPRRCSPFPYAVIDSGDRQVVIVDVGEGRFEPRPVKLGSRGAG